jgi:hypothetical protein
MFNSVAMAAAVCPWLDRRELVSVQSSLRLIPDQIVFRRVQADRNCFFSDG